MPDLEPASLLPSCSLPYLRNLVLVVCVVTVVIYIYKTLTWHHPSQFKLFPAPVCWGSCVNSRYHCLSGGCSWAQKGPGERSLSQVPTAQKNILNILTPFSEWLSVSNSICPLLLPVESGARLCNSQGISILSVCVLLEQALVYFLFLSEWIQIYLKSRMWRERKKKMENTALAMRDDLSHFTGKKSNRITCLRISSDFVAIPYLLNAQVAKLSFTKASCHLT